MRGKDKWYNNAWVVAIGSGVVIFLLPTLSDAISNLPFLTTWIRLSKFVLLVLTYKIELGWLFAVGIVVFSILYIMRRIEGVRSNKESLPKWLLFTATRVDGYDWTWEWKFNMLLKTWEIIDPRPTCQTASCNHKTLTKYDTYLLRGYMCDLCFTSYDIQIIPKQVEEYAYQKIKKWRLSYHLLHIPITARFRIRVSSVTIHSVKFGCTIAFL